MDVGAAREHAIGENGRQGGTLRRGFGAQRIARANVREARYGADAAGGDARNRFEARSRVDAELVDLLGPRGAVYHAVHLLAGTELAAGDLEPGDSLAAFATAYAVHASGELVGPGAGGRKLGDGIQELGYALVLEGRAKQARKDVALGEETPSGRAVERACLEKLLECRLVRHGGGFAG